MDKLLIIRVMKSNYFYWRNYFMKCNTVKAVAGVAVLLFVTGVNAMFAAPKTPVAIAVEVRGLAQITEEGQAARTLTVGKEVGEGDQLETQKGAYVKLIRTDSSVIKLNQNTKFSIDTSFPGEEKGSKFSVKIGQMFMKVFKERGVSKKFTIKTPTAVCAVRGTEVDVNVDESGISAFTVFSGEVEVSNDMGAVVLTKGNQTKVEADQPPAPPVVVKLEEGARWDEEAEQEPSKKDDKKDDKKEDKKEDKTTKTGEEKPAAGVEEEAEVVPEPPAPPIEEASPTAK